jgi:protein-tyrosine phosphatase
MNANKRKIVMVCLGNICRSPLAEGVMLQILKEKQMIDHYEVDSAGTIAAHLGELPDHRARKVAENHGFKLTHLGRQFTKKDFDLFDDILVMDDSNYDDVISLTKNPVHQAKVKRIVEFDQRKDAPMEVADPYYGNINHFEAIYEQLRHCIYGYFLQNLSIKTE